MTGLESIGWPSVTPAADERRGAMVCVSARDAAGLCATLMERDTVTSFRDNNIRATVHFYNSEDDIDRFVAALKSCRARHHPTANCCTP